MAKVPKKVRLVPGSDVAVAVREAERDGAPVEFEEGDATYRFVPDTELERRATTPQTEKMRDWMQPPTPEELERRQRLAARILAHRKHRVISPYTAADLVHAGREKRSLDE